MAKSTIDDKLAALRRSPDVKQLRDALRSSTGILVAAAAKHVAAHADELRTALLDDLAPAFDRLSTQGIKRDPGCHGKLAVVTALYDLDVWDDVFERGLACVQAEPQWRGAVDTAAAVRALCGLAHAHFVRRNALDVLGELLADPARTTRAAAATALGNAGRPDATALLRFKLITGDDEPAVIAACAESLLGIAHAEALPLFERLLAAHDERAEAMALALGGSRLAEAYPLLSSFAHGCLGDQRGRVGFLALALLRCEESTAELLELVAGGEPSLAQQAAAALATFQDDPALWARVVAAARKNVGASAELARVR
jgi:hypothetical protein